MIQLYKKTGQTTRFWQGWAEDDNIVIHWGVVGSHGDIKEIPRRASYSPTVFLEKASAKPRSLGYRAVPDADLITLITMYKRNDSASIRAQGQKRARVEQVVGSTLGWTGNGATDGCDYKRGQVRVFAKVVDAQVAKDSIVAELKKENLLDGITIGWEESKRTLITLHPVPGQKLAI